MNYEYDFLVFFGRFQPLHNGHVTVINSALERARRVIVVIGNVGEPRSDRNPFSFQERAEIIRNAFPDVNSNISDRLIIAGLENIDYDNNAWLVQANKLIRSYVSVYGNMDSKIGLIGHKKDHTSFYLDMFPNWGSVNVPQEVILDATHIREAYFADTPVILDHLLPSSSIDFLKKFVGSSDYKNVREEVLYHKKYREPYANLPYPPIFSTTDAVVTKSGFILLIKRRANPGKGLFALPGGFVEQNLTLLENMIKELREETKLRVPTPVLIGNIKKQKNYDNPWRSSRGRIITTAFHISLPPGELDKVRGGTDARSAHWIPIDQLRRDQMFEDHYSIIQDMLGLNNV